MHRRLIDICMIDNSDGFAIPTDFEPLSTEFLGTAIDTLFDRAAERWSERIAINESRHHWTYRELQQHVDRLAALLAQAGAADQDRPVALWLPIGASVIVAMLATLKAGGFYVVIDPRYPAERNSAILNNSEAAWVITDEAHRSALEAYFPGNRLLMWHEEAAAGIPVNTSSPDPSSRRAAIVYTSGSTGQPKGVVHSHAFILGWTQLYVSDLHMSSSDRVSLLYSASVAGAIRDIYGALLTGAMLLPFTVREHSFNELARYLVDGRVTIYHSVATLFRELMTSRLVVTGFSDVRTLVFGGERVLARDLSLIRERFTASTMVYTSIGSTEAGTFARLFLRADSDPGYAAIPLGFVPAGCRVILMDDHNTPVPDGEPGDIVVESRYLADEYWRNPQETAQAFSAAPHDPSLRRYHTGDLGMRDADGMLRHCGRSDRQFKVRGHRIEPAEIEAALLAVPQVTNVIVCPQANGDDTQAVAYLEGLGISNESLRIHCARLLPQHMIPAAFYSCEQFPRLPNNKVDYQQLSRPGRPVTSGRASEVKAGEAATLIELWQSFFPGCQITANTDFFAAGGDSLQAIRMMGRVNDLYGVAAPVTLLFQYPTLGGLERELQDLGLDQQSNDNVTSEVQVEASGSTENVAFTYAQTNVQLYEQLFGLGYAPAQLNAVAAAYDLALSLFSALLRPEGKPFVNHLVGTASILAQHDAPFPVVVAGLLHAAYAYGEFGSLRCGVTPGKRHRVRAVIGEEAEVIVYRYTRFQWNARVIDALKKQLPDLSQDEQTVIFMRLANELEEGADASLLYCAEETRLLKANYLGMCVGVATAMDMQQLAFELESCHQSNSVKQVPGRPEFGRRSVYSMPTLTRLKLAACHALRKVIWS
jgi:amino acid adenylation domain-containing protein